MNNQRSSQFENSVFQKMDGDKPSTKQNVKASLQKLWFDPKVLHWPCQAVLLAHERLIFCRGLSALQRKDSCFSCPLNVFLPKNASKKQVLGPCWAAFGIKIARILDPNAAISGATCFFKASLKNNLHKTKFPTYLHTCIFNIQIKHHNFNLQHTVMMFVSSTHRYTKIARRHLQPMRFQTTRANKENEATVFLVLENASGTRLLLTRSGQSKWMCNLPVPYISNRRKLILVPFFHVSPLL